MQKMQEIQVQSLSWEDPLEEGIVIHFSILAWRIPSGILRVATRTQLKRLSTHACPNLYYLNVVYLNFKKKELYKILPSRFNKVTNVGYC